MKRKMIRETKNRMEGTWGRNRTGKKKKQCEERHKLRRKREIKEQSVPRNLVLCHFLLWNSVGATDHGD
jgi:hypothetical protein